MPTGILRYDERRYRQFMLDRLNINQPRLPERIGAPTEKTARHKSDSVIAILLSPFDSLYEAGALVCECIKRAFEALDVVFKILEILEAIWAAIEAVWFVIGTILRIFTLFG